MHIGIIKINKQALEDKLASIQEQLDELNLFYPQNEVEYLYGCKAEEFRNLPHLEALRYKFGKARELYAVLTKYNLEEYDEEVRRFRVNKAIRHTEKRISELS